jgi:Carboxypeptidase regulatory-like domain
MGYYRNWAQCDLIYSGSTSWIGGRPVSGGSKAKGKHLEKPMDRARGSGTRISDPPAPRWLVCGTGSKMAFMRKSLSIVSAVILLLVFGTRWAGAYPNDDDGPMSDLRFIVVKDYNGKPVRNAAVILHPVNRKGKQSRGGLELKTDGEGRTNIDGIPYGPLRIQVLAPGFQTFGEDYQIDKPEVQITVKLKRPGEQYSTYENHGETNKPDDKKPQEQKPQ